MGMDMDPAALEQAKPFDRAFIDAMVPHHQGAVAMANQLLKQGEQPGLHKMAPTSSPRRPRKSRR